MKSEGLIRHVCASIGRHWGGIAMATISNSEPETQNRVLACSPMNLAIAISAKEGTRGKQ